MKRLICSFDGTWNDDKNESQLTNVVKLHRAILPSDAQGVEQRALYIVGIATAYTGRTQFLVGASGIEVSDRVKTGYQFLAEAYEPGDEIYLFGFSRGAFEARSLAGLIALLGLVRNGDAAAVDRAWSLYRQHASRSARAKLDTVRQLAHYPVPISCIGVWDTVGNLGNPLLPNSRINDVFDFHDTRWHETLAVGLHALAVDEARGPFRPTMWSMPKRARLPAGSRVEQVWFAGCHADVGGGYPETALSDISLLWMAERVGSLTRLALDLPTLQRTTRPDPLGLQHSEIGHGWGRRLPFVRLIKQDLGGVSLLRRLALGSFRTNQLYGGEVSLNESVHDSVLLRLGNTVKQSCGGVLQDINYRPRTLRKIARAR